ncbi:hypothetical protein LSAT2_006304 [Lamellibrachia satsuma]|nr:hypothetical protein LSAT2_006304 [Lamellibrachia satsuma]
MSGASDLQQYFTADNVTAVTSAPIANLRYGTLTRYNLSDVAVTSALFGSALWNIHLYVTPAIIFVGLVGNACSFVVFVSTHLRELSASVYLASLAVADTGFLLQLFAMWLGYVRVFVFHLNGWCQTFVYVSYVTSFLSVWLVVGFTVERYVAVCHPLRRHDMCTLRRAKMVVAGLTTFSLLFYSFGAWTSGLVHVGGRTSCVCLPQYIQLVTIMNNFDTVVTLVIPMLAIVALNARIVCATTRFQGTPVPKVEHFILSNI